MSRRTEAPMHRWTVWAARSIVAVVCCAMLTFSCQNTDDDNSRGDLTDNPPGGGTGD